MSRVGFTITGERVAPDRGSAGHFRSVRAVQPGAAGPPTPAHGRPASPSFCLHQEDKLAVYYAPFDHVNEDAKVAVVGITPGWNQMEIAHRAAWRDLHSGLAPGEILRRVKHEASFAGSMQKSLVSMLDELGMHVYLEIESTGSLFAEHRPLLHATSAVRYPVFVEGANYTGHSPKLLKKDFLRYFIEHVLAGELRSLRDALIVPLSHSVSEALEHLAGAGKLDRKRCLIGFPPIPPGRTCTGQESSRRGGKPGTTNRRMG